MRFLVISLTSLLLVTQYQFWIGGGGLFDAYSLQTRVKLQKSINHKLAERNKALLGEVLDLKQGYDAVEERGRTDFGLVKPGETFYQVVDSPQSVK